MSEKKTLHEWLGELVKPPAPELPLAPIQVVNRTMVFGLRDHILKVIRETPGSTGIEITDILHPAIAAQIDKPGLLRRVNAHCTKMRVEGLIAYAKHYRVVAEGWAWRVVPQSQMKAA